MPKPAGEALDETDDAIFSIQFFKMFPNVMQ